MKIVGVILFILGFLGIIGSISNYYLERNINIFNIIIFIIFIGAGFYFLKKKKDKWLWNKMKI